jgi:tRNA (guanine-N7-)-methyltransferase
MSTQQRDEPLSRRRIRSFVRRQGRMTTAQREALTALWSRYGLAVGAEPLDLAAVFGRAAPVVLEIGFGNGEALVQMALRDPQRHYLGIEVHRPGVGQLIARLEQGGIQNVRVICADVVEVLTHNIADASLDQVLVYFPDPWPKKRHHKRRLIQPELTTLLGRKLAPGGQLHLATDWEDYAAQMLQVISASGVFANLAEGQAYSERPEQRPLTKFERRGQRLGHGTWDLLFRRL